MSKFNNESKGDASITKTAIAIAGPVDSGKSSFVGVCTSGVLDDGRGSARSKVAKHKHEIDSGQTSDISTRILKLDDGRALTFIDLCGHEKYLKTTVRGIAGYFPDYGCLIISPQRGVTDIARQHYKMLISQNIPIFIVITRIDVTIERAYKDTVKQLTTLLKVSGRQTAEFINGLDDYNNYESGKMSEEEFIAKKEMDTNTIGENLLLNKHGKQAMVPIVTVSNVTGYYIDVCKNAMNNMEPRDVWNQDSTNNRIIKTFQKKLKLTDEDINRSFEGSVFYIDASFKPTGIGLVVSGILRGDSIKLNDTLYMGPFGKDFVEVKIKGIHNNNRQNVSMLDNHSRGCFNISFPKGSATINRNKIKKGIVLASKNQVNKICYRFKAAIFIFSEKSVSIKPGYSPVMNAGTVSQSARVLPDDSFLEIVESKDGDKEVKKKIVKKTMGPGSIASLWFKFRQKPEHLTAGSLLTFRSGEIHGVGMIIDTLPVKDDDDAKPDVLKKNRIRKKRSGKKSLDTSKGYKSVEIKL